LPPRMEPFRLVLVDPNPKLCDCFRAAFQNWQNVSVVKGRFEELEEYDCMVSPANSFGLMDGGVDRAIISYFGEDLQERVQRHILKEFLGEQPVGTSFIIETKHSKHPFLAHTPTMRVPMDISRTENTYQAMFAMLVAVHNHNQEGSKPKIMIVACPGLGTATGRVPPEQAANQMALAFAHYLRPPARMNWEFALARQKAIEISDVS
jgi:O-acetyl-ADP-ribose deacetylase (regulator of RNase III)